MVWFTDKLTANADAYDLLTRAAREEWVLSLLPDMLYRASEGKPMLLLPDRHFNLSHSGHYGLCALSRKPVGADIQIVKNTWRDGLPARVCSPEELEWLDTQLNHWRGFALLWALKEARVKYTGTGLRTNVREISVPLPRPGVTLYRHDHLWFRIYEGEDWVAAVCGEEEPEGELIKV